MVAAMQASSPALPLDPPVVGPDVSSIVTEDDTPVDNLFSEKQQRLFTEPLYSGWSGPPSEEDGAPRAFMAAANVGVFTTAHDPPTVPDVFVSLDVQPHKDIWAKEHRSYFVWEFGKMPDLVIEVVSNREGGELSDKKKRYRKMPIAWYVVWDPGGFLSDTALQGFELRGHLYVRMTRLFFDSLGLGLVEWTGAYEGLESRWLRWCDAAGALIPTGAERAEAERQRAEAERQRAEAERQGTRAGPGRRADGGPLGALGPCQRRVPRSHRGVRRQQRTGNLDHPRRDREDARGGARRSRSPGEEEAPATAARLTPPRRSG
jgi:hypothetical protein